MGYRPPGALLHETVHLTSLELHSLGFYNPSTSERLRSLSMFTILPDDQLLELDLTSTVVVEQSKLWHGQLQWAHLDQQGFVDTYSDYVSRYGQLNELFMVRSLTDRLTDDGYTVAFAEDTAGVLGDFERWSAPLPIAGLNLRTSDGEASDLYDYQRFSLNRALERLRGRYRHERLFYYGWAPGTGKSAVCAAGALEAINRGQIDVVLAFTTRKLKLNLRDFFTNATPLNVAVCDGTKARRAKLWNDRDVAVYVNNYDKAFWDHDEIAARIGGQRVLFIFDEVAEILTADKRSRVRKAVDDLLANSVSTAWPMSASIVDYSPFTYHDNFSLGSASSSTHPLGTRKDFEGRYCNGKTSHTYQNSTTGHFFTTVDYDWNHVNLQEVRHRVAHCTQSARKTDPGVRENFPGMDTIVVPIQLSEPDRRLYDIARTWAQSAFARGESPGPYLEIMRYICNHPAAVGATAHAVGAKLAAENPRLITGRNCSKLEVFCNQVESIAAAGEKVVGFTKWTSLSLHLVSTELARRDIRFVDHHGDMSDQLAYDQQQRFKNEPDIALFWSSDAGSHGLSFQMARYVINYEVPYSWSKLNQRMSRIDRADGKLTGRTNYVYVTDNTLETRIWETNQERMALAEATTGGRETSSYGPADEPPTDRSAIEELLFG